MTNLGKHFHKPTPLTLLILVSSAIVLFGLGTWQMQRLAWKEGIIAALEEANASAPLARLPDTRDALEAKRFYHVTLTGEYVPETEFHLAARYFKNQLGYSIFNPFRLTDGRLVLVNRGWVPTAKKAREGRPGAPAGRQTIVAQIRTSNERNYFTPPNQPQKNVWFGRDVEAMGEAAEMSFEPLTLDRIDKQDPQQLPVPSRGEISLRNDHLGYAVTWYSLCLGLIVIGILYHRKKPGGQQ